MKIALTIAGFDPSGGAGIQADIKTFKEHGIYGLSAPTAITVQDSTGVKALFPIQVGELSEVISTLFEDFDIKGIKIGMLATCENIRSVARLLDAYRPIHIVVDPVFSSSNGYPLLEDKGVDLFIKTILPLTYLITPNILEASMITGSPVEGRKDMERAALEIKGLGARNVLVKGGHLKGIPVDILCGDDGISCFEAERIEKSPIHGTGCVLSSAITANLVNGYPLKEAVYRGREFVLRSIRSAERVGSKGYFLI